MSTVQIAPDREHQFFLEHGHYGLIKELERWDTPEMQAMMLNDKLMSALPEIDLTKLPNSMGVAKWMQIENQGSVGSCAGHARTSCQELAYYRQTKGKTVQLNRMYAYLTAQQFDGIRGDRGSTVSGNCQVSHDRGTAEESIWPYPGHYTSIPSNLLSALDESAKKFRIHSWKKLRNYYEVLQWLVHGIGGVNIGIQWSLSPEKDGVVNRYSMYGGGHSIGLLDWNKQYVDSQGRPYICLFNSWGPNWGDNGVGYIHPDVIDEWCSRQDVIGMSDMMDIAPREFIPSEDHFIL